ncbi:MAG: redox-sensing transcriptional repressor Rex [Bulleidia sp.]|nr:redox-sensing transcriptional repressor Rex [Erysipelotrichaceae bacterium]MDD6664317.1 redox-sensing transcriptional repressor Rex [Bulleidia sp.]
MAVEKKVPKATLQRYPVYLKALRRLKAEGVSRVMSKTLADYVSIESTTIRRDFSFLGNLGKQGYGYDVNDLIQIFSDQLGVNFDEKIILIGAGNLGKALLNYNNWNHVVGEIVCAFDLEPERITGASVPVYGLNELSQRIPSGCRIAILCISKETQETVDLLVKNGIRGIVSFAVDHFSVPPGVYVKQVDVVSSIQELVFETNALHQ